LSYQPERIVKSVQLKGVEKRFGKVQTLKGVDLEIEAGEFLVCVGPSGCGKSTILRIIAGLESPTSGQVLFDGADVTALDPSRREIGMAFQSYALYPHFNVEQNISFGLSLARLPKEQIRARVDSVARTLKIDKLLDRLPRELSGGQRQRVAIGRALAREPKVFLLDEPLSNLDAELRTHMRVELGRIQERIGATTIYVTHDQAEAMTLAHRIAVFNQGRLEAVDTPAALYSAPPNRFVAGFIGSPKMNFMARPQAGDTQRMPAWSRLLASGAAMPGARAEDICEVGVRPEHWEAVGADAAVLEGSIAFIENIGSDTYLHVSTPLCEDPLLVVRAREPGHHQRGERICLRPQAGKMMGFNADGIRL
jgi:ABC-type sugar transport system ATPase subunit